MEEENKVVEETTTEVTETSNTELAPVTEEKSLLQEVGEWIVLALIIGLIWKLCNLMVSGVKKVIGKVKKKIADKKASKEAQAPVATVQEAPVAAPAAPQEPVEGTENK